MQSVHGVGLFGGFALLTSCVEPTTCRPEGVDCPHCLNGTFTCTYDDVTITSGSCDACSTRVEVYDALCGSGRDLPLADVDAELTCSRVVD